MLTVPLTSPTDLAGYLQYGIAGFSLAILVFVVRVLREVSKESADRGDLQRRECDARNDKTVATVDSICDRFADTQVATAKLFSETTMALVHEQRDASDKREERLLLAMRELKDR